MERFGVKNMLMTILLVLIILITVAIKYGLAGLVLWGIGSFIVWAFGIAFTFTFWHGLAIAFIINILARIFGGKK